MATAAQTRERILETAWDLIRERGIADVTVAQIAAAAGVSRQLVYVHFENRAGLLTAMARHNDVRTGFRERMLETRSLDPVERLEATLRVWWDYLPEILPVGRALEAALVTGDEGGVAWADRMHDLWDALRLCVGRVARAGRLRPGWTRDAATDWILAHCQLAGWQTLVVERGWSPADYVERELGAILAELVVPASATNGPRA